MARLKRQDPRRRRVGQAKAGALFAVLAVTFAAVAGVATGATAGGAVPDQGDLGTSPFAVYFFGAGPPTPAGTLLAQTFVAGKDGKLTDVRIPVVGCLDDPAGTSCGGNTGSIVITITSVDGSGAPHLGNVLGSTAVPGTAIPQTPNGYPSPTTFTFAQPLDLTAGSRYAIVLGATGTSTSADRPWMEYGWSELNSDAYPPGQAWQDTGGGWSGLIGGAPDFSFQTDVAPRAAPSTPPSFFSLSPSPNQVVTQNVSLSATAAALEFVNSRSGGINQTSATRTAALLGLHPITVSAQIANADEPPTIWIDGKRANALCDTPKQVYVEQYFLGGTHTVTLQARNSAGVKNLSWTFKVSTKTSRFILESAASKTGITGILERAAARVLGIGVVALRKGLVILDGLVALITMPAQVGSC